MSGDYLYVTVNTMSSRLAGEILYTEFQIYPASRDDFNGASNLLLRASALNFLIFYMYRLPMNRQRRFMHSF